MDFQLPEIGEGVYEAEFVSWLVKPGDVIKRGQNLMEVLTDKATMEVPSPFAGKVTALHLEPGAKVKVGDVVLSYVSSDQTEEAQNTATAPVQPAIAHAATETKPVRTGNGQTPENALRIKAAPSVRLMARKLGIALDSIHGSGPGGRILIDDLSAQVSTGEKRKEAKPATPSFDVGRAGTTIKMQGVRRKIAEQMVRSKTSIPHYAYVDECDVSELVKLRSALKNAAAKQGVKLTYLPFFVKAVAMALQQIPIVNATYDESAGEIRLHDHYNIGMAVAAPAGLIVPVIRDAHKKNIFQIARDIERLSQDARAGKSKLEDLKNGTFTVTSIGGIGGLISTPVINHPEVGILGIGKVVKRPVYNDQGQIVPADLVYLSFSFDHRVVDGAIGAVFGNAVKSHLETPATMLIADMG